VRREREEEWRLVISCNELGSIDVMRLDQTLSQSRHVACASGCLSLRTSLEEGIKLHRFAGIFPKQFSTEAGRHREAVVAADQRMVIRCFRDDIAGFVHDVSHVPPQIQRTGRVDAAFWRYHEGRDRQSDAAEHLKGMAYHEAGHAVVAYLFGRAYIRRFGKRLSPEVSQKVRMGNYARLFDAARECSGVGEG
jgi:hypothetical protein